MRVIPFFLILMLAACSAEKKTSVSGSAAAASPAANAKNEAVPVGIWIPTEDMRAFRETGHLSARSNRAIRASKQAKVSVLEIRANGPEGAVYAFDPDHRGEPSRLFYLLRGIHLRAEGPYASADTMKEGRLVRNGDEIQVRIHRENPETHLPETVESRYQLATEADALKVIELQAERMRWGKLSSSLALKSGEGKGEFIDFTRDSRAPGAKKELSFTAADGFHVQCARAADRKEVTVTVRKDEIDVSAPEFRGVVLVAPVKTENPEAGFLSSGKVLIDSFRDRRSGPRVQLQLDDPSVLSGECEVELRESAEQLEALVSCSAHDRDRADTNFGLRLELACALSDEDLGR